MSAEKTAAREKLERAVDVLVNDYIRLINTGSPDPGTDPKGFATFHGSGKVTLSHLDYLLKMVRTSGGEEAADEAAELLAQARRSLGAPEEESQDDA